MLNWKQLKVLVTAREAREVAPGSVVWNPCRSKFPRGHLHSKCHWCRPTAVWHLSQAVAKCTGEDMACGELRVEAASQLTSPDHCCDDVPVKMYTCSLESRQPT